MKKLMLFALVVCAFQAHAGTFTANGGQGTSIIDAAGGAGVDYTSLAAAAADFNSFAGGAAGDATFLIRSNLTEPNFVNFANETNGHTVTLKPAPTTQPVITFTSTTRAATSGTSWEASILIGPRGATNNTDFAAVDNFVIDGSNTLNGTSRDLTLVTPDHAPPQIQRIMVRVVGDCDNVIIKNTIMLNGPTGTTDNIGVEFSARRDSNSISHVPSNGKVINCELTEQNGAIGQGVVCRNVGSIDSGLSMTDMVVENCDINSGLRGVLFNNNAGGAIRNNRIRISQFTGTGNNRIEVINYGNANNYPNANTIDISGNILSQIHSIAPGGINFAIGVGGANFVSGVHTFNITNNIITGYETTATVSSNNTGGTADWLYRGIAINITSAAEINVYHNSLNMVDQPTIETVPPGGLDERKRLSAISFISASGFFGTFNFVNNIVRFAQHNGEVISNTPGLAIGGTLNFNNNTYFQGAGAKFAFINDTEYQTLSDWQTSGKDVASNSVDPFAPPSGGAWVSQSDLHFNAAPSNLFNGAPLAAVSVDVDNQPRSATAPTKGADEFSSSAVAEWMLF